MSDKIPGPLGRKLRETKRWTAAANKPSAFSGTLAGGFDAPLPAAPRPAERPKGFDISHLNPDRFDAELGIMLGYVCANEGRKMVLVPGHPDILPSYHGKLLCDLRLVKEIGSYHFISTEAGRAVFWGLVLTSQARQEHLDGSRSFYAELNLRREGGEEFTAPYEEAREAFLAGRTIADNPYTEAYARWDWETAFLKEFEWASRDGGYTFDQARQVSRHDHA